LIGRARSADYPGVRSIPPAATLLIRETARVSATESPLLRGARREALVVLAWWLTTLVFTVGYCYRYGYGRTLDDLTFVCGFPDWVFWGIVVPWVACFLFSTAFALFFMQDTPLGDDAEEGDRA
jgi:Protein of unknown function (DUF997)